MKKNLLQKCGWLTIICLLCSVNAFAQKPVRNLVNTNGYTSNGTATIPANAAPVVKAEAWGAGGAGGYAQRKGISVWVAAAGGGGGAYAADLISLTSDRVLTMTVGTGGTNSDGSATDGGNTVVAYNGNTLVEAGGGKSVTGTNNKTGAEGGKAIKGGNNRKWNGGNGGSRGNNDADGGGGGAAASPTAKGANANGSTGGRSSDRIAGSGADGQSGLSSASAGDQYGGGGAGAVASVIYPSRGGGAGANGYVRLTYMIFNIKDTTLKTGVCSGGNLSFTPAGDYPRDASFTWTATNDNVTITGNGTTQANSITATLVNNTQTTQNVVFNCVATYTDNTYGLGTLTDTFTLTVPVYAQMTPGQIMAEQFVCAGQTVNQLQTVEGQVAYGGKDASFRWQISTNNSTWTDIKNGNDFITTEYYTPYQSNVNYFRRQYVDETCGTVTSNVLKVTNVNPMNLSDMTGFEVLCAGSGQPYEKQFTASISSGMGSGSEYTIYWQKRVNDGEWINVRVFNTQAEDSYTFSFTPTLEQNGDTIEFRYAVKFSTCDSVFCNGTYKIVVRKIEDYTNQFKDVTILVWYGLIDTNLTHMKAPVLAPPAFSVTGPTVEGSTPEDLEHVTPGQYVFSWKVVDSCGFESSYTQNVKVEMSPCEEQIDGYKVVRIGRDCWMAENLREEVEGASYYEDNNNNRAFGLLYDWNTAMTTNTNNNRNMIRAAATPQNGEYVRGVCPEGWAIPTLSQFNTMVAEAGGVDAIKSTEGWAAGYEGNNNSGFNAMAPGYFNATAAQYQRQLAYAGFWVVDDNQFSAQGQVPSVKIDYFCDDARCIGQLKTDKLSIRCVKVSQ